MSHVLRYLQFALWHFADPENPEIAIVSTEMSFDSKETGEKWEEILRDKQMADTFLDSVHGTDLSELSGIKRTISLKDSGTWCKWY